MTTPDEIVLRRNYENALKEIGLLTRKLEDSDRANAAMLAEIKNINAQIAVLKIALDPFASLYRYISQRREMGNLDTTPVTFIHLKNADAAMNGRAAEGDRP